jgi:hypothetical protein
MARIAITNATYEIEVQRLVAGRDRAAATDWIYYWASTPIADWSAVQTATLEDDGPGLLLTLVFDSGTVQHQWRPDAGWKEI